MFTARRKPKRIISSDPDNESSTTQDGAEDEEGPVLRRPVTGIKQKSKLRMSFDPAQSTDADGTTTTPRSTSSNRLGVSALSKAAQDFERSHRDAERPSYSKSYLDELKGSTPATPKDLSQYNSSNEDDLAVIQPKTQALDIASKFGSSAATLSGSAIPSAAEIAEKKDRRNRLAKEQQAANLTSPNRSSGSVRNQDDFVSLDAYDSDGEFKPSRLQVSTYLHKDRLDNSEEYTRLVPEDEDIAEGFEDFVDDERPGQHRNRITMSLKQDPKLNRDTIRSLINTAEGASDSQNDSSSGSDDDEHSDASAEHAYMAAQTRHGAGFSHLTRDERRRQEKEAIRPRQPEKTTPIPTLASGLARLRELKEHAETSKQRAELRSAEIERRLKEVDAEKVRIQSALEELGRQLDETNRQVADQRAQDTANGNTSTLVRERGLEDLATSVAPS